MEATEPQSLSVEQAAEALIIEPEQSDPETKAETEPAPETTEPVEAEAQSDETQAEEADETDDVETDAEAEADEEDEVEPDTLHTVKVDGVEQQVSYDELLRGYAGQAYVQKGMSENATKTKELEAQLQTLNSERQAVLQVIRALQTGSITPEPQPPNPELAETDPVGWMQEQARFQAEMTQHQQQQAYIQQLQEQQQAQSEQAYKSYMQEQRAKLVEFIPEFGDAEKAPKIMAELMDTASHYGFEAEEVRGVMDARALAILKDAASYRALQSSTAKGQKKVQGARPVVKPGAKKAENKGAARKKQLQHARQTQSTEDWAATLLE